MAAVSDAEEAVDATEKYRPAGVSLDVSWPEAAGKADSTLYISCLPFPLRIGEDAVIVRFGEKQPALLLVRSREPGANAAINFINEIAHPSQTTAH